ncbi:MAG: I78 family peptidase inhibitor [Sphingomicrobium sp.]
MRPLAALAIAASLGACVAATPIAGGPRGVCTDSALGSYLGQPASQDLGARLLASSGARVLRWAGVGMMMTMEYRADRLTVHLGPTNLVTEARCG